MCGLKTKITAVATLGYAMATPAVLGVNVCGLTDPLDFSGIKPLPFGGEFMGVGPTGTSIVNTEVVVQFTTAGSFDAANISAGLMLVHVNGGASTGFTGANLGWSGQGTFRASFQTDALNGTIVTDQPFSGFLFFTGNLNPAGGPAQGVFDSLVFKLTYADCPSGDATMDADVDIDDLLAVVNAWGSCPPEPSDCRADFDNNDVVNIDDLLTVINRWGPWCGNCK